MINDMKFDISTSDQRYDILVIMIKDTQYDGSAFHKIMKKRYKCMQIVKYNWQKCLTNRTDKVYNNQRMKRTGQKQY